MRIPISITNWKSRAMAAEDECDSLRRELTMADALEVTLRGQLDHALERIHELHCSLAMANCEKEVLTAEARRTIAEQSTTLGQVRCWIDHQSSTVRRAVRVNLAEFLGWTPPPPTVHGSRIRAQVRALAEEA